MSIAGAEVLACSHPGYVQGYPLYEAPARLPPGQVAQATGPIASIDGRDVTGKGGILDLLPGCHVIVLESRFVQNSMTGDVTFSGDAGHTVFAVPMQAGHRYLFSRDVVTGMSGTQGSLVLKAVDESPNGDSKPLQRARTPDDVTACERQTAQ